MNNIALNGTNNSRNVIHINVNRNNNTIENSNLDNDIEADQMN